MFRRGGIAIHTLGTSGFAPAQRLFQFAQRFLERLHAIPQFAGLARLRRRTLRALQSKLHSVPGEDGRELACAAPQLRNCVAIGVLGERVSLAEHVGEKMTSSSWAGSNGTTSASGNSLA